MEAITGLMASQQKIIEVKREGEKTRGHEIQTEKDCAIRMEEMQLERGQ
jgi:hypothetical protein